MPDPDTEPFLLSTGDLAKRFGVGIHAIVAVVDRCGLSSCKIGRARAIKSEDVEKVRIGLIAGNFMKSRQTVEA